MNLNLSFRLSINEPPSSAQIEHQAAPYQQEVDLSPATTTHLQRHISKIKEQVIEFATNKLIETLFTQAQVALAVLSMFVPSWAPWIACIVLTIWLLRKS